LPGASSEAPDALTTIVLASRARLVVCPSMDFGMWRHAATQDVYPVRGNAAQAAVEAIREFCNA
jgi:hypothetical protein